MKNMFCAKTLDLIDMFNNVSFAAATRTELVKRPSELWTRCVEIHADGTRMRMTTTNKWRFSTAFVVADKFDSNKRSDFKCSVTVDDLRFALKSFKGSKELMLYTVGNALRVTDTTRSVEVMVSPETVRDWSCITKEIGKEPMAVLLDKEDMLASLNSMLSGVKFGEIRRQDRDITLDIQDNKVAFLPSDAMIERAKKIYFDASDKDGIPTIRRLTEGFGTWVDHNETDHFMPGRMQLNHSWLVQALESTQSDKVAIRYGDRSLYKHTTMYEGKIIELLQPVTITHVDNRCDLMESPTVHRSQPMRLGERGWSC